MVSDPAFQRAAASFPLTRWIARRKGRALFDLCAGFVYSQVLVAFVRLGVAERLSGGPRTLDELSDDISLEPEAAERLMRAAAALGLVEHRVGGTYALADLGAAMLGNAGVAEMVTHHAALYADLADPVALLRGETAGRALESYWGYATAEDSASIGAERTGTYSELMAASLPMIAEDVLDAYPMAGHRRLMDVGGGIGGFARAAATRTTGLNVVTVDLPTVAAQARLHFEKEGIADRAQATGLDFHRDPLPGGADLISLVRVCFDHPDERVAPLLARVRAALPPGGRLLIAEPMTDMRHPDAVGDAYFGFYLMAMGRGRCRSVETLRTMLSAAGFRAVRELPTRRPMLARLLVAEV
ncbi:MAG: acetylserotonin O-methyltransferase [Alphaproteobacteria bacterium]|nr:acetylserotonin O-methyltransferase [Alphaproteobacteria bacterium]